jgi:hypothetical protein
MSAILSPISAGLKWPVGEYHSGIQLSAPKTVKTAALLSSSTIEEPQLIAKILSHLERAAPEQYQSELPLRKRGPPLQPSLL